MPISICYPYVLECTENSFRAATFSMILHEGLYTRNFFAFKYGHHYHKQFPSSCVPKTLFLDHHFFYYFSHARLQYLQTMPTLTRLSVSFPPTAFRECHHAARGYNTYIRNKALRSHHDSPGHTRTHMPSKYPPLSKKRQRQLTRYL